MAGYDFILPPDLSKGIASTDSDKANPLPTVSDYNGDAVQEGSQNAVKNDFNNLFGAGIKPVGRTLQTTYTPASEAQKYPNFNPLVNNEELYAASQSGWSKLVNGVGKAGVFAGTTFLETWLSLPDMIKGLGGSNLYKNEWATALDEFRNNSENWLPNYYSEWERDHPFKSMLPFSGGFANFLGDKFIKNLGFTVGALAGAASQSAVLGAVTGGTGAGAALAANTGRASLWMSRLLSGSNNASKALKTFSTLNKADDVAFSLNQLRSAALTNPIDKARYALILGSSTHTEAGIEAREGYESLRETLINDFQLENGYEPVGTDLQEIESIATAAGNTRYALNAAIIGASNVIQFNTLLKTFSSSKKALQEGVELGGKKIGLQDPAKTIKDIDNLSILQTKGVWNRVKPIVPNILSEGVWEEGSQFAVQTGTESYFRNKYHGKHKSDLDAILSETLSALTEQFSSTEGWESMILGSLTGAVFSPVSSKVSDLATKIKTGQTKQQRVLGLINNLNTVGVTGIFQDNYDNTANSLKQQEDIQNAVNSNNVFKYKNLKADSLYNFAMSASKMGRIDIRVEQLEMLKSLPDSELQSLFGTDRNNSIAYIDQLITKIQNIDASYKAISNNFQNPYTYTPSTDTIEGLAENQAFQKFEEYKSALNYYSFKQDDYRDRILNMNSELSSYAPGSQSTTIQELTSPKGLKEKSIQYEERAASLENSLEGLSPEIRRSNTRQIKELKTLSQNIKDLINQPDWNAEMYTKVFNSTMNYETNGDQNSQSIPINNLANVINLGHDLNNIDREMDYINNILSTLNTEQGFNDFLDQYDKWREELNDPYSAVREIPVESVKGNPVGTKFQVDKAPLFFIRKNDSGTYSIIDPITGEEVSVHSTRPEAQKNLFTANEQRSRLNSFTLVQENENGTIRVRDREGNIQDIDPQVLNGYNRVKTQLEIVQENPEIVKAVTTAQEELPSEENPTGDFTKEKIDIGGRRKDYRILPASTTSPTTLTVNELNTRNRNEQLFLNQLPTFPNRGTIKAVEVTKNTEESVGLKGLTNYVMNRSKNDTTDYPQDTNSKTGAVSVIYIDTTNNSIIGLDGKSIRPLSSKTEINFDSIPVSVRTNAELTTESGATKYRPDQYEQAKAIMEALAKKREELFKQTEFVYNPYSISVSRGIPIRDITGTKENPKYNNHPVTRSLIPRSALNTPLIQISEGSINFKGESYPIPSGRPVIVYNETLEYLQNRKFSKQEANTIYKVLLQASTEAYNNKGRINPLYYSYLQGVLYFHHQALKPDINLSGKNLLRIDNEYNLTLGDFKIPFTPEEIQANEAELVERLQDTYNNVSKAKLKDNKPFEEVIDIVNNSPVTQLWDSYQHYLLSDRYDVAQDDSNYNKSRGDIPLTTSVIPITENNPYNHIGKYIVLDSYDLSYQPAAVTTNNPVPEPKVAVTQKQKSNLIPQTRNIPENKEFELKMGKFIFHFNVVKEEFIFSPSEQDTYNELVGHSFIIKRSEETGIPPAEYADAWMISEARKIVDSQYPIPAQEVPKQPEPKVVEEQVPPTDQRADIERRRQELNPNTPEDLLEGVFDSMSFRLQNPASEGTLQTLKNIYNDKNLFIKRIGEELSPQLSEETKNKLLPDFRKNYPELISDLSNGTAETTFYEDLAKSLLELVNLSKINSKYDAELAALEKEIPQEKPGTQVKDLEGNVYTVSPDQIITYQTDYGTTSYIKDDKGDLIMLKLPGQEKPVSTTIDRNTTKPASRERKSLRKGSGNVQKPGSDVPFSRIMSYRVERMTPEDREEFKRWTSENLPLFPDEELDSVISINPNEEAWGMMENGVAKFYKEAERGTEYHEKFEQVWAFILTPQEQQELISEFRSTPRTWEDRQIGTINSQTATDYQIKERIADDFAQYRLGKMKPKSWIKRLFDRIMNVLRYFSRKPSTKQQLFDRINTGYYKDRSIDYELAQNIEPQYARIVGLDQEYSRRSVQDVFIRFMGLLFQDTNRSIYNIADITDETIFGKIKEQYINEDKYKDLGDEGFQDLVEHTKKYLRTFKVVLDQDSTVNDSNHDRNEYAKQSFTIDAKSSSPWPIKLMIASLAKVEAIQTMNELPDVEGKTEFGMFVANDFSRAFITVMSRLANLPSWDNMLNSLKDLSKENADFVKLFERLRGSKVTGSIDYNNLRPSDWRMITSFFSSFAKQNPTPDTLVISNDTYFTPASLSKPIETIKDQWYTGIRGASENGEVIKLENNVYKILEYKGKFHTNLQKLTYLNKLGINFSKEVYNKLSNTDKDILATNIDNVKKYLGNGKDTLKSITIKSLGISSALNNIAALYTKVAYINTDSVYYGPENKPRTVYENKNSISKFADIFNNINTLDQLLQEMPQLQDTYVKNSLLLSKGGLYFDKEGNRTNKRLEVHTFLSVRNEEDDSEALVQNLTESNRYLSEFLNNLEGRYYTLIPADSSTEWATSIGNLIGIEYINNPQRFQTRYYTVMRNYLRDEIDLALSNRSNIKAVGNKAQELRFFREILDEATVSSIETLIKDGDTKGLQDYIEDNKSTLNTQFSNYLNYYSERTIQNLRDQGILNRYDENTYAIPLLSNSLEKVFDVNKDKLSRADLNKIVHFHSVNYILANNEYHKVLFGDPYSFTIKSKNGKVILDETKRIKHYGSPNNTTFNSPEFNTYHNLNLNKAGDISLTPKDPGYNPFRDYYNSITLSDISVDSTILLDPNTPQSIKDQYQNINEADASSWRLLSSYRDINMREGSWDYDGTAEEWYQYEMALTRSELAKKGKYQYQSKELENRDKETLRKRRPEYVIEVRKPITTGNKYGKNTVDNLIDKTSELPLYYSLIKDTNLEELFIQMFQKDIQHVIVESGRKQGIESLQPLYNQDGTISDIIPQLIQVGWNTYGKQVENAYSEKQQTEGSQITKLVTMDLLSDGKPIDYTQDNWDTLSEQEKRSVSKVYNSIKHNDDILKESKRLGYYDLLRRMGIEEINSDTGTYYSIIDGRKLQATLLDEMTRRELSDNAFESLQWNEETNSFTIPFEASNNYVTIRNILYSIVDKAIVSQRRNGGPKVQVTASMWEPQSGRELLYRKQTSKGVEYSKITKDQYNKLTDDQRKNVRLASSNLKFYTPDAPYCEVLIPNWFRNKVRQSKKLKNYTDEQLIGYLNSTKEGQDLLMGIGFRIPTQALSSIEVFKVKGFLDPSMGNTVVVPSEITTKAGSDFDIDKLNTYLKNVYIDSQGDIKPIPYYGVGSEARELLRKEVLEYNNDQEALKELLSARAVFTNRDPLEDFDYESEEQLLDKIYQQSIENEYYNSLQELLQLPQNYQRLLNPNGTGDLIPISEELDTLMGYSESNIKNRMLDFNYLNNLRHMFVVAKKWVGIGAVNITGHALSQRARIILDPTKIPFDDPYLTDLDIPFPHNTINISGVNYPTISGIMSQDGQYISDKLSSYINAFVDVAKDPFIMKIIKHDRVVGIFMLMERLGIPTHTSAYFMNQPIIQEYLKSLDKSGSNNILDGRILEQLQAKFGSESGIAQYDLDTLKNNISTYYINKSISRDFLKQQVNYLETFTKMARIAENLFDFSQAYNYDTTSFRSGDILYKKQLATSFVQENNIFRSVDDILDNSFIGTLAQYIDQANQALSEYLILQSKDINEVFNAIKTPYITRKFTNDDTIQKIGNKLNNTFLSYLIAQSFPIKTSSLTGTNSLAKRVQRFIESNPDSMFLSNLETIPSRIPDGPDMVRLKFQPKIPYEYNLYTESFRELREDPETEHLYKTLQAVAILQGLNPSPFNLTSVMPLEDDTSLGYSGILQQALTGISDPIMMQKFSTENYFERNNWKDSDIVPEFKPNISKVFSKGANGYNIAHAFLSPQYNNRFTQYDVIKVKRYQYFADTDQPYYTDLLTGKTISPYEVMQAIQQGDFTHNQYIGYKKVYDNGTPLDIDNKQVYKIINLLGDGTNITEFNPQSLLENGTVKVTKEQSDQEIVSRVNPGRFTKPMEESIPSYNDILTLIAEYKYPESISEEKYLSLTPADKLAAAFTIKNCNKR